MSTYVDKPQSLIERKKAQWAKEREELEVLSAPWRFSKDTSEDLRARDVTKLASNSSVDIFARRRPSLPPICKNQTQSYSAHERYDKEMGGETSGYGSDNPNNTPEYFQQTYNPGMGYESSSSARDDRAKWGDRGVGVGRFWDPHDTKYCKKIDDTPGWVKRGLSGETELVVSNTSPAESPEQDDGEQRPYTGSTNSQTRTYIRGQNNPVDPVELAERERKRQAALAHQEAIKQQLEEREQRRRQERERRIREEYEEEVRIAREQEMEQKRREHEDRLLTEKLEREKKRKEALQEAIHLAEKEAQEVKLKQKMMRQTSLNISENVKEKDKVLSPRPFLANNEKDDKNNLLKNEKDEAQSNNINLEKQNNIDQNVNNKQQHENNNNNCSKESINEKSCNLEQPAVSMPPQTSLLRSNIQDNIAMVIQPQFENYPNVPFAILMPTFAPLPPTPIQVGAQMPLNNQIENTPQPRTENRILTPTRYRNRRFCDSSTQTEIPSSPKLQQMAADVKYVTEKVSNFDLNFDARHRKDSKCKINERLRDNPSEKPKWGANRPPTRYVKQSEKDPFYQRRKFRQKVRQLKLYDDKNNNYSAHSSDDSQVPTPRSYRKNGYIEKRRTRALWQKNVQVYQTEIVPLETDKDNIYYKKSECLKCCCDCRSNNHKYSEEVKIVDILKIEHTPREDIDYKDNKSCFPECNNNHSIESEVLDKLNCLHNGLLLKQEQWQNSPGSPDLSFPSEMEINC